MFSTSPTLSSVTFVATKLVASPLPTFYGGFTDQGFPFYKKRCSTLGDSVRCLKTQTPHAAFPMYCETHVQFSHFGQQTDRRQERLQKMHMHNQFMSVAVESTKVKMSPFVVQLSGPKRGWWDLMAASRQLLRL